MTLKPGIRTTEFLLAVLTAVGATAASLTGTLAPKWAAVASAVATFAYSLSRGIAKAGAGGGS